VANPCNANSLPINTHPLLHKSHILYVQPSTLEAKKFVIDHHTQSSTDILMAPVVSKIAIIGAGVSGLAAAKQLAHHNPIVFEATDSIGGVWRHCSYNSTKLQSHRCDYEFSDFPWPERENHTFPSHTEILDYLQSYAEHFDVLKCVRFNTKVVEIRFVGDREAADDDFTGKPGNLLPGHPVWEVAVQTNHSETIQVVTIYFLNFSKQIKDVQQLAYLFEPINYGSKENRRVKKAT
jgi:hypothetical protein